MSPILVRPVREQLEHDRIIRLLQAKYKRKFEVAINPGMERAMAVGSGASAWYPDLVLQSSQKGRKLMGVVEVETTESVNHLEAMSQWTALSKLRAPFHLYVPSSSIDAARRLCAEMKVSVAEIWAYSVIGEQVRFTPVQRAREATARASRPRAVSAKAPRRGVATASPRRPAGKTKTRKAVKASGPGKAATGRGGTKKKALRGAKRK